MDESSYRDLVRNIFKELNIRDIYYVVPRNYSNYPDEVGKDLDILIEYRDLSNALNIFFYLSWKMDLRYYSKRKSKNEFNVLFYFGRSEKNLCIDIHHCISLDFDDNKRLIPGTGYRVFPSNISRKLITVNSLELYVPTEYSEAVLKLRQWLFKRKPEYFSQVSEMILNVMSKNPGKYTSLPFLQSVLKINSHNDDTPEIYTAFKKASIELWGKNNIYRFLKNNLICIKSMILQAFTMPPIIYFSGPDGAGKTTMMNELMKHLSRNSVSFINLYDLKFILRKLTQRFSKSKMRKSATSEDNISIDNMKIKSIDRNRDDGSMAWKLKRLLALIIGLLDILLGYTFTLIPRLRGQVVVVETSPYDIFVKYHMPRFRFAEKYLSYLVPKPSVGFLLHASPEAIRQRKPELTINEIDDYYIRINKLVISKNSRRYVCVRTDDNLSNSIATMLMNLRNIEAYDYK